MNLINVTLNVHLKSAAFQAKHLKDPDQQLAWKRAPIRSNFWFSSKAAPCLQIDDKVFWNSIDNHNRSRERYIGLMSRCLSEGRVKDFRNAKEKLQVDIRIRGCICHGSRDENEWVAENVWCFLIKWKQKSRVKISAIIALVVCNVAYCKIENYVLIRLAVVAFKVIGSEQE